MYTAYLKDGTAINFRHPVDCKGAIASGAMLAHPPGKPAPVKKIEPEGEVVVGVETVATRTEAAAEVAKSEKKEKKIIR